MFEWRPHNAGGGTTHTAPMVAAQGRSRDGSGVWRHGAALSCSWSSGLGKGGSWADRNAVERRAATLTVSKVEHALILYLELQRVSNLGGIVQHVNAGHRNRRHC